jgi:MATE family multidrug resistance protein
MFSHEPAVVRAGSIVLIYAAIFQFSDSIGILSYGALRGAGDTKFPAAASMAMIWFVFLPLGWYLGRKEVLGVHGAWLAATVHIWLTGAILFHRFVGERWRKIDIFR